MCFLRVDEICRTEKAFGPLMQFYESFNTPLRRIRVSKFARAVVFELAQRDINGHHCRKPDVLMAAHHVKQRWPNVPFAEPLFCNTVQGRNELCNRLVMAVAALKKQKEDIEQQIADHQFAIKALQEKLAK